MRLCACAHARMCIAQHPVNTYCTILLRNNMTQLFYRSNRVVPSHGDMAQQCNGQNLWVILFFISFRGFIKNMCKFYSIGTDHVVNGTVYNKG